MSEWVHGVEEPHLPAPRDLIDAYPKMIDHWVFSPFGDLLELPVAGTV